MENDIVEQVIPLEQVLDDLRGFGIQELDQILTINVGGRKVNLRIANIPTEADISAMLATDEYKGYPWVQRVKCEILSRSITYINGWDLRALKGEETFVKDPNSGERKHYQVVLRNVLLGWGIEVVAVLWKILMVHAQKIEDKLVEEFPDSTTMTEVERRVLAMALDEIDEASKAVIQETVAELYKEDEVKSE